MIDSIATSLAGMQTASRQVNQAAEVIANPQSYGIQDVVDIGKSTGQATIKAAETVASGSLESAAITMKVAATMYKANAEMLSSMFEMQKEAFEQLA